MKIQVYAVLKEYFDKEFSVQKNFGTIQELKDFLMESNPEAKGIISKSRFAVHDEFVDDTYTINNDDHISIMPPSSGG